MEIVGNIIIAAGVLFMLFGVIGIYRYKSFYPRILVSSKSDTVGALTVIIGIAVRHGPGFFSWKLLLLIIIILILNPLLAHVLARSAYLSGHEIENSTDKAENQ